VLVAFAVGFLFEELAKTKGDAIQSLEPKVQEWQMKQDQFKQAYSRKQAAQDQATQMTAWLEDRYYWGDVLAQLRQAMIRSEDEVKKKLSAQKANVEAGIWIEQMTTIGVMSAGAPAATPEAPNAAPAAGETPDNSNNTVSMVCRAVNLSNLDPSANSEIAYAVESELKACPIFDPKMTQLTGNITPDDSNGTFTFGVTVTLLHPLKL